jgi:uncharacterized protein (TIGR03083 family)
MEVTDREDVMDFVAHVRSESQRFLDALSDASPDARVPTCPDWDAADLLWHLGEVQGFWSMVVNRRITDGDEADAADATQKRPADWGGLVDYFTDASSSLLAGLTSTPSETTVWTWADEQTAGFVKRRQAHEALIHRIDAELVVDKRTPIDPELATDGVDEVLRVMYGEKPSWGEYTPRHDQTVRIVTTDTDRSWLVTLGWFKGTSPESGKTYDLADLRVAPSDPGDQAAATIIGGGVDLDCWLWHRPTNSTIGRTGDESVLNAFDETIAAGID